MKLNETIAQLRREHWSYLLVLGVVALLVASFLTSLISETYRTIALRSTTEKAITEIQTHAVSKPQINSTNIKPSNISLFGTPPTLETTPTSGKYTLMGLKVSTENPSLAMALIQSQNNDSDVYHVGDKLPQGGTVMSIQEDGVVIQSNGIREKLTLTWDTDNDDNAAASAAGNDRDAPPPNYQQGNIEDVIKSLSEGGPTQVNDSGEVANKGINIYRK